VWVWQEDRGGKGLARIEGVTGKGSGRRGERRVWQKGRAQGISY